MLASIVITVLLAAIPQAAPRPATASAAEIEKLTIDGKAQDAVLKGRAAVAARPDDIDLRLALARGLGASARKVKRLVNVPLSEQDVAKGTAAVSAAELANAPSTVEYDPAMFEEAILHLNFGIAHAPARKDLRVLQCFLLTDAGRIDQAKIAIGAALRTLPKDPALAATMAAYGAERAKRGDPAGGATLLAPVAEAFPKDPTVLVDYANVLTRCGRKTEANATFDRVTVLAPHDVRFMRTKAVSAMLLRDYKRAQSSFDAAFREGRDAADQFASHVAAYGLDPTIAGKSMHQLGTSASTDPSVASLANQFALAATKGAGSKDAIVLARTLASAERYVFAIPVLDRALKADAGNADAKTMMKEAYTALGCPALAP